MEEHTRQKVMWVEKERRRKEAREGRGWMVEEMNRRMEQTKEWVVKGRVQERSWVDRRPRRGK